MATDLSLAHLNDFLKSLHHSANGYAFIVEPDGNLIATSRGPHLRKGVGDDNTRLNAANSDDPLIAMTYKSVKALLKRPDENAAGTVSGKKMGNAGRAQTGSLVGPGG